MRERRRGGGRERGREGGKEKERGRGRKGEKGGMKRHTCNDTIAAARFNAIIAFLLPNSPTILGGM